MEYGTWLPLADDGMIGMAGLLTGVNCDDA